MSSDKHDDFKKKEEGTVEYDKDTGLVAKTEEKRMRTRKEPNALST